MADEDLEALLRKKNLGEVKMTPQGFIDDAGTLYIGKHISAREHKGGRLGDFKWIELPDGSVFQIEKKVPAYGTIPGELPFNQTLADEGRPERTPAKEGKPPPRGERALVGRTKGGVVSTPSSWKKPEFKKAEYPPHMSPQDRKTAEAAARALAREQELLPIQGPMPEGPRGPDAWERPLLGTNRATEIKAETEAFQTLLHGDMQEVYSLAQGPPEERLFSSSGRRDHPRDPSRLFDRNGSIDDWKRQLKKMHNVSDEEYREWLIKKFLETRHEELHKRGHAVVLHTPEELAVRTKEVMEERRAVEGGTTRKGHGYWHRPHEEEFFLKSRNFERMINAAQKKGMDLAPDLIKAAKKLAGVGLKVGLGAAAWGADLLMPSELGAASVGEEFRTAEEVLEAEAAAEESAAFLAEQPGYEPEGTPPAWAEPGWYEEQRFGERDLSPEGVEDARRAAAKRALEERK